MMAKARKSLVSVTGVIIGVSACAAGAQTPTFSLEAAAINGTQIENGPVSSIACFAGDVIQAQVYLRDWSPEGQALTGYQAALLPISFSSGDAGYIEPVGYAKTQASKEENNEHSYVDDRHPRYVHRGVKTLALADTRSEGYRWMSVMLQGKPPKCKQDGTKYYCATVDLAVSQNAVGTFHLELDSDPNASGIRDDVSSPVMPVNFEDLRIKILPDPKRILEGLNRPMDTQVVGMDANKDGRGDYRDMLFSIAAINANLDGTFDHPTG